MDCRTAQDRLTSWIEGELSPGEAELIEHHLDHCADCRALVERLSQQTPTLQLLKPNPLPELQEPGFWERMDTRLGGELAERRRQDSRPSSSSSRLLQRGPALPPIVLLGAAAAMLALLTWAMVERSRAADAQAQVHQLTIALEREQRLAAPPTATDERDTTYSTVVYTPSRGNF